MRSASSWSTRIVAGGFDFPEGPAVAADGAVYLVNVRTPVIHRVGPDGAATEFARVAGRGNGMCFAPDGALLVCDVEAKALVRLDLDGRVETLADNWNGRPFNGPNDCCVGGDGTVFFTDPDGSSLDRRIGAVFALAPDGTVRRIGAGLAYPNGLALTPDGASLIVAETQTNRLLRYDPRGDDDPSPVAWAELPDAPGPDGMRFGPDGRLYVAHFDAGTIDVFTADAVLDERIELPGKRPTNLCFYPGELRFVVTEAEKSVLVEVAPAG